ncbi:MAG: hypothetical protein JSS57_07415 [Proteobacteria bacterium]|nr:hypothetical protein [Pseudomonadota bacterium]
MTTSNEIELILGQMQTLLAQTQVLAADVAKNYQNFTVSPHFTGIPTAPTAPIGTNSDQIATTKYLDRLLAQPNGIATLDSNGLIPSSQLPPLALTTIYTVNSQAAMLALPADPGDICIRTDTNQTFVLTAEPPSVLGNWTELLFAAPVTSVAGLIGAISASALTAALNPFVGASGSNGLQGLVPMPTAGQQTNYFLKASGAWAQPASTNLSDSAALARLASPAFTGTPTAPTAAQNDNSTQIATTAFYAGQAGAANPLMNGTVAVGSSLLFSRQDHVHPSDTSRAPLTSPGLLGTPTTPTAAPGTNTTQIASTAFVTSAIGALTTGVSSIFGRSGAVTAQSGDYSVAQITGAAPSLSPTFTGTPAAPTPGSNISTTQIPTTAWVNTYFATLASPTFSGQVGFNGGTVTASTPVINGNQTWNNAAVAFTGLLFNVTDTASAAASLLLDLQVGGVTKFNVRKDGTITAAASIISAAHLWAGTSSAIRWNGTKSAMFSPADGNILLQNNAATDFGLLQFGGTSSSFPALKRSGSGLLLRVADDTSYGSFTAGYILSAAGYFNFNTTGGPTGYGLRDNAGAVEFKNSGGSWTAIGDATLASPAFTGTPTAPTAAPGTNTTQIATTAYVIAAISGAGAVASVFGRTGAVVATSGDYTVGQVTGAAPLASPTFTGTPAAPTAAVNTNTTQIATTAFVVGQAGSANPLMNGSVAVGTSLLYARQDHVHPVDTSRAPLASPTFTGTPAAPTPGSNINTTQIPTTAWVNTYYAAKASPTFTGTPAAPTAAPGTNTTQLATTAFVAAAVSGITDTFGSALFQVSDEVAAGAAGGTTSAGANTRTLNTVIVNQIAGASLSAGAMTLPAGEYIVIGFSVVQRSGGSIAYLYNTTDSAILVFGSNEYSINTAYSAAGTSYIYGRFTLAATKNVTLVHNVTAGLATYGFGNSTSVGGISNRNAELMIWKVA